MGNDAKDKHLTTPPGGPRLAPENDFVDRFTFFMSVEFDEYLLDRMASLHKGDPTRGLSYTEALYTILEKVHGIKAPTGTRNTRKAMHELAVEMKSIEMVEFMASLDEDTPSKERPLRQHSGKKVRYDIRISSLLRARLIRCQIDFKLREVHITLKTALKVLLHEAAGGQNPEGLRETAPMLLDTRGTIEVANHFKALKKKGKKNK